MAANPSASAWAQDCDAVAGHPIHLEPLPKVAAQITKLLASADPDRSAQPIPEAALREGARLALRLNAEDGADRPYAFRLELVAVVEHEGRDSEVAPMRFPTTPAELSFTDAAADLPWSVLAWSLGKVSGVPGEVFAQPLAREALIEFAKAGRCLDAANQPISYRQLPLADALTWRPVQPGLQVLDRTVEQGRVWLDETGGLLYSPQECELVHLPISEEMLSDLEQVKPLANKYVDIFNSAAGELPRALRPPRAGAVPDVPQRFVDGEWEIRISFKDPTYYTRERIVKVTVGTRVDGRFCSAQDSEPAWEFRDSHWERRGATPERLRVLGAALERQGFERSGKAEFTKTSNDVFGNTTEDQLRVRFAAAQALEEVRISKKGCDNQVEVICLEAVHSVKVNCTLESSEQNRASYRLRVEVNADGKHLDWLYLVQNNRGSSLSGRGFFSRPPLLPTDPAGADPVLVSVGSGQWMRFHRKPWSQALSFLDEIYAPQRFSAVKNEVSRAELYSRVLQGRYFPGLEEQMKREVQDLHQACLEAQTRVGPTRIPGLARLLKPAQAAAVSWICTLHAQRVGGLLADDRGFGKTVEAIAAIVQLRRAGMLAPAFVVMELKELGHWEKHLQQFAPGLSYYRFHGKTRRRVQDLAGVDVIVTTYEVLKNSLNELLWLKPEIVFLDEATAIRDERSARYKAVESLVGKTTIIPITGTPLGRNFNGFRALMDLVMPTLMRVSDRDLEAAANWRGAPERSETEGAQGLAPLLRPFVLRRLKRDYPDEFPEKVPLVQYVTLTKHGAKAYEKDVADAQNAVAARLEAKGKHSATFHTYRRLDVLRRTLATPFDAKGALTSKGDYLLGLIRDLLDGEHRVLVFTHFKEAAREIQAMLRREGIASELYLGEARERDAALDRFKDGAVDVLILTSLGKSGLDIPEADTVVINDLWIDPSVIDQMMDRPHRRGSRYTTVTCYQLVTEGTLEETALKVLTRFREASDVILDGASGFAKPLRLTQADIQEMLGTSPAA